MSDDQSAAERRRDRDDIQYGDGWIDWAHVEITPLSQARLGLYLPVPTSTKVALLAYRRSSGLEVDLQ